MPSTPSQDDLRTTQIPIQDDKALSQTAAPAVNSTDLAATTATPATDAHYQLHIEAAKAPNEIVASPERLKNLQLSARLEKQQVGRTVRHRFWGMLEWLATSALIFMAIFFFINYQAYSELFISKVNQIWGNSNASPSGNAVIGTKGQTDANHGTSPLQQPLPLAPAPDEARKQIPNLNIDIAPPDDRIILPRINKNVPIVQVSDENLLSRNWGALEKDIQAALQNGVIHYPRTAYPGQHGNVVITGHSSYYSWDPGRFKDVFALLHQLNIGDTVIVYHEQQKYTYQIYDKKVVTPDQVDVLAQEGGDRLTLITCTPVGTNLKRLVVLARPV